MENPNTFETIPSEFLEPLTAFQSDYLKHNYNVPPYLAQANGFRSIPNTREVRHVLQSLGIYEHRAPWKAWALYVERHNWQGQVNGYEIHTFVPNASGNGYRRAVRQPYAVPFACDFPVGGRKYALNPEHALVFTFDSLDALGIIAAHHAAVNLNTFYECSDLFAEYIDTSQDTSQWIESGRQLLQWLGLERIPKQPTLNGRPDGHRDTRQVYIAMPYRWSCPGKFHKWPLLMSQLHWLFLMFDDDACPRLLSPSCSLNDEVCCLATYLASGGRLKTLPR